ncbi:MAG: hypothetical protein CME33_25635 [Gimesia sp.]|uniref:hypothetical protein n=1 Tax=Gimesia sp. TaxID=2024833 RepID=UPI000C636612|nr:hypothetical protein [Gimesia sp.]MAX39940.1 hypothetical protein [Gimesia sp.]|tara:strand:+ start:440 stop:1075 length:636 start_codon:yes stop_codon:yes gene_type:complete
MMESDTNCPIKHAIISMVEQSFPNKIIIDYEDSLWAEETQVLLNEILGKHWHDLEENNLIKYSYAIYWLGPQTCVQVLPALMKIILIKDFDCEFVTENTIKLLTKSGKYSNYSALDILESSLKRILEEDLYVPDILSPLIHKLQSKLNESIQALSEDHDIEQAFVSRFENMKDLLTTQQHELIHYFLLYLSGSQMPDLETRDAAKNAALYW